MTDLSKFRFTLHKVDALGKFTMLVDKTPDGGIDLFVSTDERPSSHIYLTIEELRRMAVWFFDNESSL